MSFTSYIYKLRSSGPFSVSGGFIVHTFKAEKSEVTIHEVVTSLKTSSDMAGQGGEYVSVSYTSLPFVYAGGIAFSGSEVKKPVIIDESGVPGA